MPFISILTHPDVIELHVGPEKHKYLMTLYGDTFDKLKEAFGVPDGCVTRGKFLSYFWERNYDTGIFRILSNPRGTAYEVMFDQGDKKFRESDYMGRLCIRFLGYVYDSVTGGE